MNTWPKTFFAGNVRGILLTCFLLWLWWALSLSLGVMSPPLPMFGQDWASRKKVYHNYFVPLLPPMDSRDPLAPPPIRPGTRFAVYQWGSRDKFFFLTTVNRRARTKQLFKKFFASTFKAENEESWQIPCVPLRGRFFFGERGRSFSPPPPAVYDSLEPETFRVQFSSRSFSFLFCRCCSSCLSNSECELLLLFLLRVSYFRLRVLIFPFWRRRRRNSIVFLSVSDDLAGLDSFVRWYTWALIFFLSIHIHGKDVCAFTLFAFYRNSVASSKCPSYATTICRRRDQRRNFRVRHHRA